MELMIIILSLATVAALWTVMARSLLRAMLGLAVTSIAIVVLMFNLESQLAGVFELSVCVGLITVIFAATVSLTKPMNNKELIDRTKSRFKRFWPVPLVALAAGSCVFLFLGTNAIPIPQVAEAIPQDVRNILWSERHLDLLGQIVIMIAGAFGVLLLFREIKNK
jgi:NADH:ubiquinone oxidoreductase subunit 6 (subunit J)